MKSIPDVSPNAGIGTSLTDRLSRWISPGWYLAGVLAGFAACVLAGYLSTRHSMFKNFVRFHQGISAETLFFPTARQIRRLAEALPPDKIAVVVGGSSRFNGVGQTESELWTRDLQDRLGDGYAVLNLALRGGGADQFGMHAAEMLLKEGRKVIYLADAFSTSPIHPDGLFSTYRYFFYDAAAAGALIAPDTRLEGAEQDAATRGTLSQVAEWRRRAAANAVLYFDDLWTWFGYRVAFLPGWTPVTAARPFAPRRKFHDNEPPTPAGGYYDRVGDAVLVNFRFSAGSIEPDNMDKIGQSADWIPEALRRHAIIVEIRNAPRSLDRFSPADRATYDQAFERFAAALEKHGIRTVDVGRGWTNDDFTEGLHLTRKGGDKLAASLVDQVRALAAASGYRP